jgi:outer membrane protein OmpA-like peptidoglycan-associated protein
MIGEIDRLNTELAKKPAVEVQRIVEAAPTQTIYVKDTHPVVVFFAQGSAELTENAIKTLDGIDETAPVSVFGYASPEGTEDFNKQLSQNRADAVANYLKNRGVDVVVTEGRGVEFGPATNRIVIITSEKD